MNPLVVTLLNVAPYVLGLLNLADVIVNDDPNEASGPTLMPPPIVIPLPISIGATMIYFPYYENVTGNTNVAGNVTTSFMKNTIVFPALVTILTVIVVNELPEDHVAVLLPVPYVLKNA